MDETTQQQSHQYALVSSLYGPGTIVCWYFTILSVLISWTLHPKKRESGSIDVDLITILTLPTVAAGHLVSQVRTLIHSHGHSTGSDTVTIQYAQSIAAIEAPFSVVESFMQISVILFLIAIWMFCLRRALAIAVVGLLCLAVECYMHFSTFNQLGARYTPPNTANIDKVTFSRSFVADYTGLIIAIPMILGTCAYITSMIIISILSSRRLPPEIMGNEQRISRWDPRVMRRAIGISGTVTREDASTTFPRPIQPSMTTVLGEVFVEDDPSMRLISNFTIMFLPVTCVLSFYGTIDDAAALRRSISGIYGWTDKFWSSLKTIADHFYTHSGNSFSDLDQAVTTAAGATVFAFSIYSVVKTRYEMQHADSRQEMRRVLGTIELNHLGWIHAASQNSDGQSDTRRVPQSIIQHRR